MKKIIFLTIVISVFACKNKTTAPTVDYSKETLDVTTSIYPENITKVFEAHGGLDLWKTMRFLEFTMPKKNGNEVTSTDLRNRKSLISMPNHTIGFNGNDVWLENKGSAKYKKDARFYYNLMFYFYAMPFILADDGIIYKNVEPLIFEGKAYPGINISYHAGVGESPEDEYVLYYNPDTYKMEWLGYTVTYFTKEKGEELHFRRFKDWQEINGLLLPKTMVRYKYENNLPTTIHSESAFTNIKLTKQQPNQDIFEVPKGAEIVK